VTLLVLSEIRIGWEASDLKIRFLEQILSDGMLNLLQYACN